VSVFVIVVLEEGPLPLKSTTNNKIRIIPLTIHTQGIVYHSVWVVVVVVFSVVAEFPPWLSWARQKPI
jgi:hypothetical protein